MKRNSGILIDHLEKKQGDVLDKWFQLVLEAYSNETAKSLKRVNNQFGNPVGYAIYHGIEGLLKAILRGADSEEIQSILEEVVKTKAMYDSTPSQAVNFVFALKKAVWGLMDKEIKDGQLSFKEIQDFDHKIDDIALVIFDLYMENRERLYKARMNEMNRTSHMLTRLHEKHNKTD